MTQTVNTPQGAMTASELRDRILAQAGKDEAFRARLLADPREVLDNDYDIALPEQLRVHVHEEDATNVHLVLPRSKKLTDAELEGASGAYY